MASFDRRAALLTTAIVGMGIGASWGATSAATSGDDNVRTRVYVGTREVQHTVDVATEGSQDADYHGVFDVQASRTTRRSGNTLFETEARFFTVRSGGYRFDAAMREVIVRDEHVSDSGDEVTLDDSELDRATFGYLTPAACQNCSRALEGVGRESLSETYSTPPLIYAALSGTHSNEPERSSDTLISDELREPDSGRISEQVSSDGTVRGNSVDSVLGKSFEQHSDGSGHSTSSATGFFNVDLQIAPAMPLPSDGTFAIAVISRSTGREVGPVPYPVATRAYTIPDWYPGGKAMPADTDTLTASGAGDTPVPPACGAASRARLAHQVIRRRAWTRISGTTEADSDETYWVGRILLCEIERRHTEQYDLASGKRNVTNDTTTTLGVTRL